MRVFPAQRIKQQEGFPGDFRIRAPLRQKQLQRTVFGKQNPLNAQVLRRSLPGNFQIKKLRTLEDAPVDTEKQAGGGSQDFPDAAGRRKGSQQRKRLVFPPFQQMQERTQILSALRGKTSAVTLQKLPRRGDLPKANQEKDVRENLLLRFLRGISAPEQRQGFFPSSADETERRKIIPSHRIRRLSGMARKQSFRPGRIAVFQHFPAEFQCDQRISGSQFKRFFEMAETVKAHHAFMGAEQKRQREMKIGRIRILRESPGQHEAQIRSGGIIRTGGGICPRHAEAVQKAGLVLQRLLFPKERAELFPVCLRRGLLLQKSGKKACLVLRIPECSCKGGVFPGFPRFSPEALPRGDGAEEEKEYDRQTASVHDSAPFSSAAKSRQIHFPDLAVF